MSLHVGRLLSLQQIGPQWPARRGPPNTQASQSTSQILEARPITGGMGLILTACIHTGLWPRNDLMFLHPSPRAWALSLHAELRLQPVRAKCIPCLSCLFQGPPGPAGPEGRQGEKGAKVRYILAKLNLLKGRGFVGR